MKAAKSLCIIIVIVIAVFAAVSVQAEGKALNVKIEGLNKAEVYLVESTLTRYKLPLTTPISIHKEVFTADWNGKNKEFDRITVGIETADGKFTATLDNRGYPQLPEEYHYGLLELALSHACQGPENHREKVRLDDAFLKAQTAINEKAKKLGCRVVFHERRPGTTEATFRIDGKELKKVICKVNFENDVRYSVLSKESYFLQVRTADDIFTPTLKKDMAKK